MTKKPTEGGAVSDASAGSTETAPPSQHESVEIISMGAFCKLSPNVPLRPRKTGVNAVSIHIEEFALLANGAQITIRSDRGVSIGLVGEERSISEEEVSEAVLGALLPDEAETEDEGEPRSWHELASRLTAMGFDTTPAGLKALPYEIRLSSELGDTFSH